MKNMKMLVAGLVLALVAGVAVAQEVRQTKDARAWAVWSGVEIPGSGIHGSFSGSMLRSTRRLIGTLYDELGVPYALDCRKPDRRPDGKPILWEKCYRTDLWSSGKEWEEIGARMIPAGEGS